MVNAKVLKTADVFLPVEPADLPEEELRWTTVRLHEVMKRDYRLEASVFGVEGRHARELLKRCKWPLRHVCGDDELAQAYHRPRFKRIWVEYSDLPIFQPSQITELNPKPSGYLSPLTRTDVDALRVHKGQILLTCSGTIGNCTVVSKTLDGRIFSHDVIRITCNDESDTGYLYAFLRTKTGKALIRTNEYGAVVSHIEPYHLENIPIPDPPPVLKKRIHDLVMKSYALRDESNDLLEQAERLLYAALKLAPIEKLKPRYFDPGVDLRNYTVKLSRLGGRLDASFHVPIVDAIPRRLKKESAKITTIGDPRISKRIILPGHFKRVYVNEGQGVPLLGGKQIYELDPSGKKYLAASHYSDKLRDHIGLRHGMIMVTAKGTPGKIAFVPKHWDGWVMSSNMMSITPTTEDVAGYIFIWLSTTYGNELLRRNIYGAVVDIMEPCHLSHVPVPLLKKTSTQAKINRLALEANAKRTEAYRTEQEAVRITTDEVIHASENDQAI